MIVIVFADVSTVVESAVNEFCGGGSTAPVGAAKLVPPVIISTLSKVDAVPRLVLPTAAPVENVTVGADV